MRLREILCIFKFICTIRCLCKEILMLSFRYVLSLNPSVSIFLSVQVSGWSFSSGIVSKSGAFHWTKKFRVEFPEKIQQYFIYSISITERVRSREIYPNILISICFSSQIFRSFRLIASRFPETSENFRSIYPCLESSRMLGRLESALPLSGSFFHIYSNQILLCSEH